MYSSRMTNKIIKRFEKENFGKICLSKAIRWILEVKTDE